MHGRIIEMIDNSRYCAFFDVDGTIINTKSVLSFLEFIKIELGLSKCETFSRYYAAVYEGLASGKAREELNRFYYTFYKGFGAKTLSELGLAWFKEVDTVSGFYNLETLETIQEHRDRRANIILVTGSFFPVLDPLSIKIGCNAILCTRLEVIDGKLTGNLESDPVIGKGKADATIKFARAEGVKLDECYGYGDDITDLPMLSLLGHPYMIRPSRAYTENELFLGD